MLRIGIVGCGRIVEEAHAPALASLAESAAVVALADPSEERSASVSGLLPGTQKAYADWRDMLAAENLDVAVIAVPHHLHEQAICDAAAAGVDVVSEKPLATTLTEIDRIAAAIDTAGVRLAVMHNWVFNPDAQAALAAIDAGRIGAPFLVRNERFWGVPWASKDPTGDWRTSRAASGGGTVIDSAYHAFYLAEDELRSPVVRVHASLYNSDGGGDVEDTAAILLEHASGGITSIQRCGASRGGGAMPHEIHGTEGTIRFRQSDSAALNLVMAGKRPTRESPSTPPLEVYEASVGEWRPAEVTEKPWWEGFRVIYSSTFEAWAAGDDGPVGIAQARHTLAIVNAVYASAERHEVIDVPAFEAAGQ